MPVYTKEQEGYMRWGLHLRLNRDPVALGVKSDGSVQYALQDGKAQMDSQLPRPGPVFFPVELPREEVLKIIEEGRQDTEKQLKIREIITRYLDTGALPIYFATLVNGKRRFEQRSLTPLDLYKGSTLQDLEILERHIPTIGPKNTLMIDEKYDSTGKSSVVDFNSIRVIPLQPGMTYSDVDLKRLRSNKIVLTRIDTLEETMDGISSKNGDELSSDNDELD